MGQLGSNVSVSRIYNFNFLSGSIPFELIRIFYAEQTAAEKCPTYFFLELIVIQIQSDFKYTLHKFCMKKFYSNEIIQYDSTQF